MATIKAALGVFIPWIANYLSLLTRLVLITHFITHIVNEMVMAKKSNASSP